MRTYQKCVASIKVLFLEHGGLAGPNCRLEDEFSNRLQYHNVIVVVFLLCVEKRMISDELVSPKWYMLLLYCRFDESD